MTAEHVHTLVTSRWLGVNIFCAVQTPASKPLSPSLSASLSPGPLLLSPCPGAAARPPSLSGRTERRPRPGPDPELGGSLSAAAAAAAGAAGSVWESDPELAPR